jgi:glycosyltransferase involved in cell wall biosynthesis
MRIKRRYDKKTANYYQWFDKLTMLSLSKQRDLHVVLIETASGGQRGSMVRYADLVAHVLCKFNYPVQICIRRVCLAPPTSLLNWLPFQLRIKFHHIWVAWSAMTSLAGQQADIFHIIDGSQAYVARWLPDVPVVATAHDFIPLLQTKGRFTLASPGMMARWIIRKSINELKKLDRVIADSQSTKNDFVNSAGGDIGKIMVVYPAIPTCMSKETVPNAGIQWTDRRHSESVYILHVGNDSFYKNRTGVLRVFARIREKLDVDLKMAGPPPGPELTGLIRELGLANHVHFVVNPEDDQLVKLYLRAALLLFPSLYEGFGWPPLEAMACGCPVVCSTAGSLPEVVGDAALKCNVEDYEQMAKNCIAVLDDVGLASGLVQKGYEQVKKFGLERMGRELLSVYMKAINKLTI